MAMLAYVLPLIGMCVLASQRADMLQRLIALAKGIVPLLVDI